MLDSTIAFFTGIRVIGWVKNDIYEDPPDKKQWGEAISKIKLESAIRESGCVDGLEKYKYVIIVFYMHRVPEEGRMMAGSLATCVPARPSPLGITIVKLLEVNDDSIVVQGLDAFDGSSVLDIKPYKPWSLKRLEEAIPDINTRKSSEKAVIVNPN